MSIVTIHVTGKDVWKNWMVEVNGLIYSQKSSFKGRFTEFVETEEGGLRSSINSPPSKDREVAFRLPMFEITKYLKAIAEMEYKVVGASSVAVGNDTVTHIWTLQK